MSHPRHGSQFPATEDKAPRGRLTTKYHGYIIADKSNKGQDAALRAEMENVGLLAMLRNAWAAVSKAAEGNPTRVGLTHKKVAVLWVCRDYPVQLTPAETSRLVSRAKIVRG